MPGLVYAAFGVVRNEEVLSSSEVESETDSSFMVS
jgi:hypothetical protein